MLFWERCNFQRGRMGLFQNEIDIVGNKIRPIQTALERMANDLMRVCVHTRNLFAHVLFDRRTAIARFQRENAIGALHCGFHSSVLTSFHSFQTNKRIENQPLHAQLRNPGDQEDCIIWKGLIRFLLEKNRGIVHQQRSHFEIAEFLDNNWLDLKVFIIGLVYVHRAKQ